MKMLDKFAPKKFICPYANSIAIEKHRDPKTNKLETVIIHKSAFIVSEDYCKSFAFGSGCIYYDKKERKCTQEWNEKKLEDYINELVKVFTEEGAYVVVED